MRSACLIVFVAVMVQVTYSIYTKSTIVKCCEEMNNYLNSNNIKSYIRTDDNVCKNKAFIVELKKGRSICANATSKTVLTAIKKFEIKNAKISKEMPPQ